MVEQVTGELAVDLDRLVADAVVEIAARVPDYARSLESAGEQPGALVAGAIGLMLQGLRDRAQVSRAGPVIRQMGHSRSEAGVALDSLLEAVTILRELVARAYERTARRQAAGEHAILIGVQRLERVETAMVVELVRGYMDAMHERSRNQRHMMEAMVAVAAAVNRPVELSEVAQAGLTAILKATGAEAGGLWLHSDDAQQVALAYTHGLRWDEDRRLRAAAVEPFPVVQRAAHTRSAITGASLEAAGRPLLESTMAVRLQARSRLVGVLVVGTRELREFGDSETAFLDAVADHYGAALARAEQHRRETRTDFMTGLANRKEFERSLERAIAAAQRHKRPLSLMLLDLDGLKQINDLHGHQAGDVAINAVGTALQDAVRASDTVARLGGDEFGLTMPETTVEQAVEVLRRVDARLAVDDLRVSAGIVSWAPGLDGGALLRKADARLYRDKRKHHRDSDRRGV
jgi:diguanylate cyclase (GGDEF)-like protein